MTFHIAMLTIVISAAVTLAAEPTPSSPFDVIQKSYAPYIDRADPLGFPLKVQTLSSDSYKFWRGSKDLFYLWCKDNAGDWLADKDCYILTHGDLHIGNIGTYAAAGKFGTLAFGMVDFDESARLPFQLELVQGFVTMRLVARKNQLLLSDVQQQAICEAMIDSYRAALQSNASATKLLAADPTVATMFERSSRSDKKELKEFTKDDKFVTSVMQKETALPKDILRPTDINPAVFATAIAQALVHSPQAKSLFRDSSSATIAKSIKDIAQRTRIGSSGSQGLKKYFVLLNDPLKDRDHDVIFYLKQQIPTAAERSGIIARDPRSPGERCAQDMACLTDPPAYLNSWCEMNGESYWVTLKEPWSDELLPEAFATNEDLLRVARIWGTVAGAAHRIDAAREKILPRLTPALTMMVRDRGTAYLNRLEVDFYAFTRDPRAADLRTAVTAMLAKYATTQP